MGAVSVAAGASGAVSVPAASRLAKAPGLAGFLPGAARTVPLPVGPALLGLADGAAAGVIMGRQVLGTGFEDG
jgi:hypothetical protein